jgi:hypothetical protein
LVLKNALVLKMMPDPIILKNETPVEEKWKCDEHTTDIKKVVLFVEN